MILYKYRPTKINNTQKEKQFADGKKKKTYFVWFGGRPFCRWMKRPSEVWRQTRERKGEALANKREEFLSGHLVKGLFQNKV